MCISLYCDSGYTDKVVRPSNHRSRFLRTTTDFGLRNLTKENYYDGGSAAWGGTIGTVTGEVPDDDADGGGNGSETM